MITIADQIAEAKRELALRKACYPRWVKTGRLSEGQAAYCLAVQEEIVRTLSRLESEQHQLPLFAEGD